MNKFIFIPLLSILLLSIDTYVYQAVKLAVQNANSGIQIAVKTIFWFISALIILGILAYNFLPLSVWTNNLRVFFMGLVMVSIVSKLFMMIFLLIEDITRVIRWGVGRGKQMFTEEKAGLAPISRSEFLAKAALAAGTVPAVAFTYGIISGAHDYRLEKVKLAIPNLPKSFHGLRIAQISDVHSGSFWDREAVSKGIDLINKQKADMVFFTGDLVNDRSDEIVPWKDLFSKIKAPLGVYSTLGNHDYGDYVPWPSAEAKKQNLQDLIQHHKDMGWDILLDEHRIIEKDGHKLAVIGIQNWSAVGKFPKYGNLKKAYQGVPQDSVQLLLSHDPSHWKAEVQPHYPNINATFSGHTHGMQFGVDTKYYRWSPVKMV